ncbi:ferritin [Nocardioides sp. zg-1230]|nr:ferritin [Nocardioides sp. zg-1230]
MARRSPRRSSPRPPDVPADAATAPYPHRGAHVPASRFVEQLNAQIGNELAAHNQYLACAIYYDALTMPRMAAFFYEQALEERGHAMMMVQYLVDTDAEVVIPGVDAPTSTFADVVAPVELALAQERRVTDQINGLLRTAREEGDFASEQFMQWFIKEQVEEVATMSDLLAVATRNRDDIEDIEEYVAREHGDEGEDPTAPRQAGAGG